MIQWLVAHLGNSTEEFYISKTDRSLLHDLGASVYG